jgi:hypothetical protein
MSFEYAGQRYEMTLGSDVVNDGMYLQMADSSGEVILEAFYSDAGGGFTLHCRRGELPYEVVEHFIAEARRRLPPLPERPT